MLKSTISRSTQSTYITCTATQSKTFKIKHLSRTYPLNIQYSLAISTSWCFDQQLILGTQMDTLYLRNYWCHKDAVCLRLNMKISQCSKALFTPYLTKTLSTLPHFFLYNKSLNELIAQYHFTPGNHAHKFHCTSLRTPSLLDSSPPKTHATVTSEVSISKKTKTALKLQ